MKLGCRNRHKMWLCQKMCPFRLKIGFLRFRLGLNRGSSSQAEAFRRELLLAYIFAWNRLSFGKASLLLSFHRFETFCVLMSRNPMHGRKFQLMKSALLLLKFYKISMVVRNAGSTSLGRYVVELLLMLCQSWNNVSNSRGAWIPIGFATDLATNSWYIHFVRRSQTKNNLQCISMPSSTLNPIIII